jgi:hypothetical protein
MIEPLQQILFIFTLQHELLILNPHPKQKLILDLGNAGLMIGHVLDCQLSGDMSIKQDVGNAQGDQSAAALVGETNEVGRVGFALEAEVANTVGRCLAHNSVSILVDKGPDRLLTLYILDVSVYSISICEHPQKEVHILVNRQGELQVLRGLALHLELICVVAIA